MITELESAHAAALAREEELRARWGWPRRIAVSLGVLLALGGIVYGLSIGWQHLPRPTAPSRHRSASDRDADSRPAGAGGAGPPRAARPAITGLRKRSSASWRRSIRRLNRRPSFAPRLQIWERGDFAQAADDFPALREISNRRRGLLG